MSTINFYLDKRNRKGECPIFLVYQNKGRKFKHYTKEKVQPKSWDKKKQKVKKNYANSVQVNSVLNKYKSILEQIERDARYHSKNVTTDYVRERFNEAIGKTKKADDFYSAYDKYIKQSKITKSESTISKIKSTLKRLKDFESERNYPIRFDNIDSDFYDEFTDFLINDLNFLNNTVAKHIKTLKAFLNFATDKGYNKNKAYQKFKASFNDADIIYLTEEELLTLYNKEFNNHRLKKVRDLFCFACFTGLRYSDLRQLKKEHIHEDHINLRAQKTRDALRIPLNDYAREILERYDYDLPRVLSNQKMNKYIKELGKKAGIDQKVSLTQYSGSDKIINTCPKYECLTTHTARRTFITLALEKGMRAEVVMQITGHKNYETFKKYIKITNRVKKEEMQRIWKK